MRAVIQRVKRASVRISGEKISEIGKGMMLLLCVMEGDTEVDAERLSRKISGLRIFSDEEGKMNLSLSQVAGEMMIVSQFTLSGDFRKGNRPSFIKAASGAEGELLYAYFCRDMEERIGKPVARGVFGADMEVEIINDGPVTLIADTEEWK